MASNIATSAFTLCSSVLQTYFSAITSYLHDLVSDGGVLQPYLVIVASYFNVPYTKASLFISNAWSSLKIWHIVIKLPFQSRKMNFLTVLGSQPCTKAMALSETILAMLRPLTNFLATLRHEAAQNYSQLDMCDLISFYIVVPYLAYIIATFYLGKRFFAKTFWFCLALFLALLERRDSYRAMLQRIDHNTGTLPELQRTLPLQCFSRACQWLITTGAHLSSAIRRVGRCTKAWIQEPSPFRLSSYVCGVGQRTKAWLESLYTAPTFKLLLFSTMDFVLDLIFEPLRRRTMGGYPARPWPPTSAIKRFVSHLALLLVSLVQDVKMRLRRFSGMLHTSWRYLSPTFPGGLHYGLRLTLASTVADIIDVLITLVCLAVFLTIALGY